MSRTVQICGAALALLAFTICLVIGLAVGNGFVTVVLRALAALAAFYLLGCLLATLGAKVIQENFEQEEERWHDQLKHQDQQNSAEEPLDQAAGIRQNAHAAAS